MRARVALLLVACALGRARAAEPSPYYFGVGTSLGGGWYTAGHHLFPLPVRDRSAHSGGTWLAGDLVFTVGISRFVDLQLWVPIAASLWNVAQHDKMAWADVFVRIFPGGGRRGFFVAPGAGLWWVERGCGDCIETAVAVELPIRVGWEIPLGGWLAFAVAVRPWLDVFIGGQGGVGFGILSEAAFTFYAPRR